MSYYKTWMDKSEDASNRQEYIEYINRYYTLEKAAYERVLGSYPDNQEFLNGKASELAGKLGFPKDSMDVFVGFIDGIRSSLTNGDAIDLEAIDDDYDFSLSIDYEKLYYNMRDAKADWLYDLPMWNDIFDEETKKALYLEQKKSGTIVVGEKVGRNDPCPCGSGKKYKKCCGR